jgi:hypothetical protein
VFENRVLRRRIFGPKRKDEARGWRRLHNEEFQHLYASQSIIRVIKTRRMRLAGYVARKRKLRNAYILVGKPERKRPFGKHVDGKILLEWILGKQVGKLSTGSIWLSTGTSDGVL